MPIVRKIAPPERDEPEETPPGFPPLTRTDIADWLGEATLQRGDKAELIALIRQMLARHPELETLLELPLPIAGQRRKSVDAALIRREVASAFRAAGSEWGADAAAAQNLVPLVKLGDDYASLGDWRSAATVYQVVMQGVTEHYGEVQGESGDLHAIVSD